MKSIDAIVNEWKRKNILTDAVDTGPKRVERSPSPDPDETDDGDRSDPEDDIERILALEEKRQVARDRRIVTKRIREAYEGLRPVQDTSTTDRLLNQLAGLRSYGNAKFVDNATYLVRHMAASAVGMEGQWASAIRVITDEAYGDLERAQFPLTAPKDATHASDEFLSSMPLGYEVRDVLFDRGLLVHPPDMAPAWQESYQYTYEPDQSQPDEIGDAIDASQRSDDDVPITDNTTTAADDVPSSPPREANDPLAPKQPLLAAELMDGVLRLIREYSATSNDSARDLADVQLVDGRHSPHAHSYDLLHTLPTTLLHPEVSVAMYYSKASDRGVAADAPASRAGSLMASLRLLILVCFKLYIESTDEVISKEPADDVRMLSLLEACRSLHRTMNHPTTSTALALTDGLRRHEFVRRMREYLLHTDANDASRNGIMTKLKSMRELPPILATALGEQRYSRESPLVTLLIHVCEFVGDCLLNRLSSGLEADYFVGMQSMPIRPFPVLQVDEIRPVPPAPPVTSLERDDSMSSEGEESPILSIAMPMEDSQETIPDDRYDSQATIEDSPR
jgi:hypothetical protein